MNRRKFLTGLGTLGLFTILPGAGRVWKAEKKIQYLAFMEDIEPIIAMIPYPDHHMIPVIYQCRVEAIPSFIDFVNAGIINPT